MKLDTVAAKALASSVHTAGPSTQLPNKGDQHCEAGVSNSPLFALFPEPLLPLSFKAKQKPHPIARSAWEEQHTL